MEAKGVCSMPRSTATATFRRQKMARTRISRYFFDVVCSFLSGTVGVRIVPKTAGRACGNTMPAPLALENPKD